MCKRNPNSARSLVRDCILNISVSRTPSNDLLVMARWPGCTLGNGQRSALVPSWDQALDLVRGYRDHAGDGLYVGTSKFI